MRAAHPLPRDRTRWPRLRGPRAAPDVQRDGDRQPARGSQRRSGGDGHPDHVGERTPADRRAVQRRAQDDAGLWGPGRQGIYGLGTACASSSGSARSVLHRPRVGVRHAQLPAGGPILSLAEDQNDGRNPSVSTTAGGCQREQIAVEVPTGDADTRVGMYASTTGRGPPAARDGPELRAGALVQIRGWPTPSSTS